ncbi:MAG: hypothetical protein V1721_01085, partial [Pseudomonadota bacterium]
LSKILGCSHQTVSNLKMREVLPPPDKHPKLKGNKNFFRISQLRSLIEGKTEDEIILAWGREHLSPDIENVEQVRFCVKSAWKSFGVERSIV